MHTEGILETHREATRHRDAAEKINPALIHCIDENYSCAATCLSCADACLSEEPADELKLCIRLNLDCAAVCSATGAVASRQSGRNDDSLVALLYACATACAAAAEECERHAERHDHCRICALSCRSCEAACRDKAVISLQEAS